MISNFGNRLNSVFRSTENAVNDIIRLFSPRLALKRQAIQTQLDWVNNQAGFRVPGNYGDLSRPMFGMNAEANSPDYDINDKLTGMRALSRDLYMNSAIVPAILKKDKVLTIGSGLLLQSMPDIEYLGITPDEGNRFARNFERIYEMWSESLNSDFNNCFNFGELQALGRFNRLLSGDYFYMPVQREAPEKDFPYKTAIRLIDADLVRNPLIRKSINDDVQGGVEKKDGVVVAYHVWNCYEGEYVSGGSKCTRIPVFSENGYRQIYHVFDPERINQRRGVPLIAPVAVKVKQATRLEDAAVMQSLLSNYFTVFIRSETGNGIGGMQASSVYNPALQVTGDPQYTQKTENGNVVLGSGNIVNLTPNKNVEIASPNKTDQNFGAFWDNQMLQICGATWSAKGLAFGKYDDSYTAARAAGNDLWIYRLTERNICANRVNFPCSREILEESILSGYINAPGYFDNYANKRAWTRSRWIGSGRGTLNPVDEARATQIEIDTFLTTREDAFIARTGGRWDRAFERALQEMRRIEESGYPPITGVKGFKTKEEQNLELKKSGISKIPSNTDNGEE